MVRIEADENYNVGINEGNLCAKGRFGHGIIHNEQRIENPLMNIGGDFQEVTWDEALNTIADRIQATVNRSGSDSLAAIGSEKLTNEENYLLQKLFRNILGSNQVDNLANIRAPYLNQFMLNCFDNGIPSEPITKLQEADVVLVFNSDLPSEYPVGGNSVRFGTVFNNTDVLIANPRRVVFDSEAKVDIRMTFKHGADLAVASRLSKIIIDNALIDVSKVKSSIPNFDELVQSLSSYTAENAEKLTGLPNDVITRAAERFACDADRFVLVGNDILDTGQGEEILNALLNLCTLVKFGSTGSISIYAPREHCNSQGVNDMGLTPEFLPGYQPSKGGKNNGVFENCKDGATKFLYIAGEDPVGSFYRPQFVTEALRAVPFLIVTDVYMTETAKMADLILPSSTYAEKDGTYTNMSRHVQGVTSAILPQGTSKPDFDILIELAEALGKPFPKSTLSEIQQEIEEAAPIYKGTFPGKDSKQWVPPTTDKKPVFNINPDPSSAKSNGGEFPFTLQTNNHMFHIGNYSQHAKALVDIGPECIAEIHPEDAKEWILKEVVAEQEDVPLVVLHAKGGGKVEPINDEEEVKVCVKVSKKGKGGKSANPAAVSAKQDFIVALTCNDSTTKLKFSIRTNKSGIHHKLGQYVNLAVKFNGIV